MWPMLTTSALKSFQQSSSDISFKLIQQLYHFKQVRNQLFLIWRRSFIKNRSSKNSRPRRKNRIRSQRSLKMAAAGPIADAVIAAMSTEHGVWPDNVELYEPCKDTILLTDAASCRGVEAYLRFCGLAHDVKCRRNAEFMSPTGNVPFLRADRDLIGDFQEIVSFVEAKGFSTSANFEMKDKAEMKAYLSLIENSLVPSELYMLWWKKDWAVRTRQHYGSQFPFPLNLVLSYRRQWKICQQLKADGWHHKTENEVLEEFKRTCQALSEKLGNNKFFINDRPTELDALVFGHLHTLLTRYLPDDSLSSVVRAHRNLGDFVMRILGEFFQ